MFARGLGDTYGVFLLPLEREFGWTRSQLTGVYSVYLLVHGFTAPLVGLLFDRLGPRWVYGVGMVSLGSAFFFAAELDALWQFYFFVGVLVGLGVTFNGMVPASALLARWFRRRLSTAIGVAFSAIGVGTLVFVPAAQALVDDFGWREAYRMLGTGILVLAPVVAFAIPWGRFAAGDPENPHGAKQRKAGESWRTAAAFRSPVFWGLAVVFFCTACGMYMVVVQLVALLVDAGFTPIAAASAFGMLGLLSAASVMTSGPMTERFGYRQTISVSFVGSAIGMVLLFALTFEPSMALLALFVPVFGLCMGVRGPIVSSVSARYFSGPNVGSIYGWIYSANPVGAALGAWLGGYLHDATGGYQAAIAVALVFIGLAGTPFWAVNDLRNFR